MKIWLLTPRFIVEGFTLYALEFSALHNEQSRILKVVFGGAAVELVLHWEFFSYPEIPS